MGNESTKPIFDYAVATQLMTEAGIDVILANSKPNVGYLADYYYYEGLPDFMMEDGLSFYEAFAGIAADHNIEPFLVACTGEKGYLEWCDPWIKDRRYWGPEFVVTGGRQQSKLLNSPVEAVVEALLDRGFETARIGYERQKIKHVHLKELADRLPKVTFVDAETILWKLRLVKTDQEISRLRVACRAVNKAVDAVFRSAYAGMIDMEIEKVIYKTIIEQGCIPINSLVAVGPRGAHLVAPSGEQLVEGQILRLDIVAEYRGYQSDISRVMAFGKVSNKAVWAHGIVLKANQAMREATRPGIMGTELRKLEMDIMGVEGLEPLLPIAGHGVGRTVHEHPFMGEGDETPLTPGMTLAIEPTIRLEGVGSINIEDTVVVTEDGIECLTVVPRGLFDYE
jgi:Xaa-Pro aminopeptidase